MKKRDIIFILISVFLIGFALLFMSAKRAAQAISCGNNTVCIAFAARVWAGDNNHRLPDNFLCMSNELATTKVLICPSDTIHRIAGDWNSFTTNNTSYEIVGPNLRDNDFSNAFVRCTIHGNLGYTDGTYFDGHSRKTKW
jgi:hypothetical protein